MRLTIVLLSLAFCFTLSQAAKATEVPQTTLDAYFEILTSREISGLPSLISTTDMGKLKAMLEAALIEEMRRGGNRLQLRFFDKPVTRAQITEAPAEYYLQRLAGEILNAATMQKFFIARRDILGRIDENDDHVHYVVRLYMEQAGRTSTELQVYTLKREGDAWKLEFPPIIKQTLAVFEASMPKPSP